MSGYSDGIRVERSVVNHLKSEGYFVSRGAGSKGALGDVIAIKEGQVLLVSVKRTSMPGPAERAALIAVADLLPGIAHPIVALGPSSVLRYLRLTGPGPRDYELWNADFATAQQDSGGKVCDNRRTTKAAPAGNRGLTTQTVEGS